MPIIRFNPNENGLKRIEIFFYRNTYFKWRILFFEFNWIQLKAIGLKKTIFPIQNSELNNIHNAKKKLILFLD